jgi:hypothetical protein
MSSGILVDPINAIQGELASNSGIAATVSANPTQGTPRVYAEKIPDDAVFHPVETDKLAPAILLVGATGIAFEAGMGGVPRYELRAYAPYTSAARDLCYAALNAINERTIRRGGVVCYVSCAADMGGTLPTQNIDPDTGTPFYYCFIAATTYAVNR